MCFFEMKLLLKMFLQPGNPGSQNELLDCTLEDFMLLTLSCRLQGYESVLSSCNPKIFGHEQDSGEGQKLELGL